MQAGISTGPTPIVHQARGPRPAAPEVSTDIRDPVPEQPSPESSPSSSSSTTQPRGSRDPSSSGRAGPHAVGGSQDTPWQRRVRLKEAAGLPEQRGDGAEAEQVTFFAAEESGPLPRPEASLKAETDDTEHLHGQATANRRKPNRALGGWLAILHAIGVASARPVKETVSSLIHPVAMSY